MSAVGLFLNDPLTFLANNLVLPPFGNVVAPAAIPAAAPVALTLTPAQGFQATDTNNNPVPVYDLALPAGGDRTFDAYWCPYLPDQLHSVQLSNQADYMFTATMDGCSLGVGAPNANGDVLVSHVNSMSLGSSTANALESGFGRVASQGTAQSVAMAVGRFLQRTAQNVRLHWAHGSYWVNVVSPVNYRLNPHTGQQELESTTFGMRDRNTNRWRFYVQLRWPYGPGTYVLIDVRPVA